MQLKMSSSLRQALYWAGSALAVIGIVFVGFRLNSYWRDIDLSRLTLSAWCAVGVLILVYGTANWLTALAWWRLLLHLGGSASKFAAIKVYGVSQLAKYVPGNIFHLAGRQVLGMAAGLPVGALAKSMIWEHGSIAVAGALFGWLTLPLVLPGFPEAVSVLLLLGSVAFIFVLLRKVIGLQPARAFLLQAVFLTISGSVFVFLLFAISGSVDMGPGHFFMIGGAYIIAWLIGLVTPGAPAGVGVREMILLLLLKNLVAEADLLLAVLLGRLVTVAGDLVFFAIASAIPARLQTSEKNHA